MLTKVNRNGFNRRPMHLLITLCRKNNSTDYLTYSISGITIRDFPIFCYDVRLPKKLSTDKNCKRLKVSCKKLTSKCNVKLGSSLGNSASARKCLKKLSSSQKNTKVKSWCEKSCKECGKLSFHSSK